MFIFLTVYLFWEYVNHPTWTFLVGTGISTGMALVAKYSAVLVIPIIALIVAASFLTGSKPAVPLPKTWNSNKPRHKLLQAAAVLALILFVALLTIPPAYLFQGFQPWLSGFHQFLTLSQEGLPAFFFGEYSWHNWWGYFPLAFLIKTPVGSLVLVTISVVFYRTGSPLGYRQALFLVLPVSLIFLAMTAGERRISACVIFFSRLSVSLRLGLAYGDRFTFAALSLAAVTDWDPARLHGYIVVAHRAASACVFQRIGRWSGAGVPLLKRLQSGLGARSKRTEGIRGQRKTSDYLSVLFPELRRLLITAFATKMSPVKAPWDRRRLRRSRRVHRARSLRSALTICKTFRAPMIRFSLALEARTGSKNRIFYFYLRLN